MVSVISAMPDSKPSLNRELDELRLVAIGAVPGALLRWQITSQLNDQNLFVNVFGAAVLGILVGLQSSPKRTLLIGVGFCGSLTTFSGWILAALRSLAAGDWRQCITLIATTLGLGIAAGAVGLLIGRWLRPQALPRSRF